MTNRLLFIFLISFMVSCTKITHGDTISIILNSYETNGATNVVNLANTFFTKESYNCIKSPKKSDIDLRWAIEFAKEVKKFASMHTISEVIEISISPIAWQYIYMKQTRWDTGIVDSDLLTDTYHNKDIKEFCRYLESRKIATCS